MFFNYSGSISIIYICLVSNNIVQSTMPNTPPNLMEGFQEDGCLK